MISINDEVYLLDEENTKSDIVNILKNNSASASGEKMSTIIYSINGEMITVKDVMFKHEFNLQTENYTYVLNSNTNGDTASVVYPGNKEEILEVFDYEEYKFFVVRLDVDDEDETEMQYVPVNISEVEIDRIRLRVADRLHIDDDNEMFIILRCMPERE